ASSGVVTAASRNVRKKRRRMRRQPYNSGCKKEDSFRKWEVHYQTPKERNPHGGQVYPFARCFDKRSSHARRSLRRFQEGGRGMCATISQRARHAPVGSGPGKPTRCPRQGSVPTTI